MAEALDSIRGWQKMESRDEVLRVVAKPILLPPLISCSHRHPRQLANGIGRRGYTQDGCSKENRVVGKKGAELVAVGRTDGNASTSTLLLPSMSSDPLLRITQLEQNIRFLHEQHQQMLSSLHQEIEILRQRNRDLQFQLVFTKKNAVYGATSSESSPDDEDKPKILQSPKKNSQNLQVEMLERDVTELKAALNEATAANSDLNKALKEQSRDIENALAREGEYESRLEDADKLIRRLRRENEDQRREMGSLRAHINNKGSGGGSGGRHGSGGSRRSGGGREDGGQPHRFPPLHGQGYWQRSRGSSDCCPNQSPGGSGGSGVGGESPVEGGTPSLPHLSRQYSQQSNQGGGAKGNRGYGGNHHHKNYYSNSRGNRSGGGGSNRNSGGGNKREPSQT